MYTIEGKEIIISLTRQNIKPGTIMEKELMARWVIDLRGEPTTVILIHGQSLNVTSSDFSLYPQIDYLEMLNNIQNYQPSYRQ